MISDSISLPGSVLSCPDPIFVQQVIQASLAAADPTGSVSKVFNIDGNILQVASQPYQLNLFKNIYLLSVGKASIGMAQAVAHALGDHITSGLIVPKIIPPKIPKVLNKMRIIPGNHPIPGRGSMEAAKGAFELLNNNGDRDLVISTISGGGSALLSLPYPGIELEDLQELTRLLLTCGADIGEINTLRKHLDQVKGGGLARAAAPSRLVSLILSDVIGSPLDMIASGPTVPDPTTFREAMDILEKYKILDQAPNSIVRFIESGIRGEVPETLKPGDPIFDRVINLLVGSNIQSVEAALDEAKRQGWNSTLLTTKMSGEARLAGEWLAEIARQEDSSKNLVKRPACLIAGGETTVMLRGSGIGGRNQEVALGAVKGMTGLNNALLLTLATDGEDGPTNAAGAAVTGDTSFRADKLGLNPDVFLENNDAHSFFKALGDLLVTGPTGTNVNDLAFIFLF